MGCRRVLALGAVLWGSAGALTMMPRSHGKRRAASRRHAVEVAAPSFDLALGALALGVPLAAPKTPLRLVGGFLTVLGCFIAFQTATLRFEFTDDSFGLVRVGEKSTGPNLVTGTENAWRYDAFVNWAFLPSADLPILVYFRELDTPEAARVDTPIVVDDLVGQPHFFPAISNTKQLEAGFKAHNCAQVPQQ